MRVLYLTPTGVFSGGERVTLSIAGEMRLRGHETVYCGLEGPVRSHVEAAGVPFLALPRFTTETVRRAVAQCAPDLIHTMDFRASTYAALTGLPFVAHLHNNPPWLPGLSPNVFAMRFFCRRAARILTVSESVMGEFRYGAAFLDKTAVLGNAVDLAAVRKAAEEPLPACLADRGARGFDLAFFGRLTEQKQPLRFLDVLAALRKRLPELTAVMVGEGELRPQVEEGIRVNGLSDCVMLTGFLKNPFPVLKRSRLLVMPSAWEGFGLAAVESMALGLPVLASPVGGLAGIVGPDCGVLCETDPDFTDAAERLLTEEARYAAFSQAALRRAGDYGDLAGYFDAIAGLYTQLEEEGCACC